MYNSIDATLEKLNDRQRQAVQITEGPLLVVAGAGSGKTRMLTVRIAYLIEHCHVEPSQILAVTFTNKAAKEMKERVAGLVAGASGVTLTTFHSFCCMLLRRWSKYAGFEKGFTIYDESDSEKLMKNTLKELKYDPKLYTPKLVLEAISRAKNELLGPEEYFELCKGGGAGPQDIAIQKAYSAYQSALMKNQACDFDDLILKAYQILNNNPNLLEKLQNEYTYFLVDEYQDTNQAQYKLISMLSSKTRNLCVVGDEDQSIYSWRGATIRNIQNFAQDFIGAKIVKLEQNYRSKQNILTAASEIIKHNNSAHPKTLWSDRGDGELITYYNATDDRTEAEWIVKKINELTSTGDYSTGDVALLFRMNSLTRTVELELQKRGIPYEVTGGTKFFERREVKDILAYLHVIDNPADSISLERIINTPKRGIGNASIQKLYGDGTLTLWEGVVMAGGDKPDSKIGTFMQQMLSFMEEAPNMSVSNLCKKIINETDYFKYLKTDDPETAEDRKTNVESLVSDIRYQEMDNPELTLHDYLANVALHSAADEVDEKSEKVHLMTLHNAKGLEFPIVFIVAMEEDIFPHSRCKDSPEEIEEERRLAYVGFTRAKDLLFLTCASRRMMFGNPQLHLPSKFIGEFPSELRKNDTKYNFLSEHSKYGGTSSYSSGNSYQRRGAYGATGKTYQRQGAFGSAYGSGKTWGKSSEDSDSTPPSYTKYAKWSSEVKKETKTEKDDMEDGTMVNLKAGVQVYSSSFGYGTVVDVSGTSISDFRVTINFDKIGEKTLLLQYGRVKVIK